jgi:hypothetical protein
MSPHGEGGTNGAASKEMKNRFEHESIGCKANRGDR